jgi:cyclopropane fatty-acyl-phospholipid synthase-like methyltransferase
MEPFDTVLALGILHHLDDAEASTLFSIAAQALKPGGRLITVDGVWVEGQSSVVKYLLSRDRGQFVRKTAEYQKLGAGHFAQMQAQVRHDLLRIPYSLLVLECGRR